MSYRTDLRSSVGHHQHSSTLHLDQTPPLHLPTCISSFNQSRCELRSCWSLKATQRSHCRSLQYQTLPADVQSLLNTEHGQLLFKDEKPGGCPFSLAKFDAFVKQIPLRRSNLNARASFLPLQRQGSSQPSSYAEMFGMLMHQQQQLQQMQQCQIKHSPQHEQEKAESLLPIVPFVQPSTRDLPNPPTLALPAPPINETASPAHVPEPAIINAALPVLQPVQTLPTTTSSKLGTSDHSSALKKNPIEATLALQARSEGWKKDAVEEPQPRAKKSAKAKAKPSAKKSAKAKAKPSAKKSAKAKAKKTSPSPKKKTKAEVKQNKSSQASNAKPLDMADMKKRIQLRPNGCSKCRWKKPGCCPSCFAKNFRA